VTKAKLYGTEIMFGNTSWKYCMILFSQLFVVHKVTECSHVKILFSLSLMVIIHYWNVYEENLFKFWCSVP